MKKFVLFLILVFLFTNGVYAAPIYKYEEVIPISESITLTKVREFHSDKNISYSYIKADLTDKNTSLKLLKADTGIDITATVGNLAKTEENTVAALNADFFSIYSADKNFSLGIEIKDGELLQSPINPSTMATISYMGNQLSMSYLDFHIMAVAPNWQYNEIRHLNKHTDYYGDILMYTKDFNGGMSPAPGGEVLEVVVEDGKITEFRRKMPSVQIPENGCVLVVSEGVNMFFANNFQVGDEIRFDYYLTPDIQKAETAFGGGAMLVSEGKAVTTYSHTVAGNNPRSAIGVDKSGTTVYLVAVDGRQEQSIGMRMSHLADLMISLGCYYAVNLDGGGSTNMVASTVWNKNLHTVNSPSENRKVINAVGLTYSSNQGNPDGIIIETGADSTFIGQPVSVKAAVYDEHKRAINDKVIFSSESGEIKDGLFIPQKSGKAVITASCGKIKSFAEIFVIDKISGIETEPYLRMNVEDTHNIKISVFDNQGHYSDIINIAPFEIISSDSSVVSVENGKITAHKNGTALISIKKDDAVSYISVAVGKTSNDYNEGFEWDSISFKGYPDYVTGEVNISEENYASGKYSAQLTFDFTSENENNQGAYINLKNKPKTDSSTQSITLDFFSENEFIYELKAQFTDEKGKVLTSSFGKNYETGKWQTLYADIPKSNGILTLDSIYVLCTPEDAKDINKIYIDNIKCKTVEDTAFITAPSNIYAIPQKASGKKILIGSVSNGNTLLSNYVNNTINNLVSYTNPYAFIGNIKKYTEEEKDNVLFINIITSKGGIRNTDSSQWDKIKSAISNSDKKNVFILSNDSIFGVNQFENQVLCDYLSSVDKNVFVITGGNHNTYKNINGVSYFTLGNKQGTSISQTRIDNFKYLEFSIEKNVTFEWKNYY